MTRILEVAVDTVSDALLAEEAGAQRIELCADLATGGATPSAGAMRAAVARLGIPVVVMVRPRPGDFLYSATDIEVMLRDIELAKQCGVAGIVSGALQPNGVIDEEGTEALLEASSPLPFTFHRAIDQSRNVLEAVDRCVALGVSRVLTSGGASTARAGADVLRELRERTAGRLTIVGGGGLRADHLGTFLRETGLTEVHIGPRRLAKTTMRAGGELASWREWPCLDPDAVRGAAEVLS
jgi:copper homeostasis protein